ncbi:hypothetical protein [Inhella gelatinilytica]|uniref:Uncharacterized protein n=1 Tax=Inhella gelatinilytica TaxID=2795030 RepID=A0A931IVW5_9BURK|nr:hypothetical protein [Inhella gelatinilytica]MBH9551969.1 hypothetical protein [Inhella gelatinilytica]
MPRQYVDFIDDVQLIFGWSIRFQAPALQALMRHRCITIGNMPSTAMVPSRFVATFRMFGDYRQPEKATVRLRFADGLDR